jgi:prolyl 4-hydroxylase
MNFERNIVLIVILTLICISLFYYYYYYYYQNHQLYKGRGYCNIKDEYIEPVIHNGFISDKEGKYILDKANPMFRESKLVSGFSDSVRKSQTAWLDKNDHVIGTVIKRVCDITDIPFENAEKMQVVKYEPNGFYIDHFDASCDDRKECVEFEKNGGQRVLTMIIYLNDDFTGGTTRFKNLQTEFQPVKNNGLLFYSLQKDGDKCHPLSLHSGMPVKTGEKYIANIWLRERPYKTI